MFTGIIEEIGIVKEFKTSADNALIVVECKKVLEDTKLGDSIAINGVCQTVTALSENSFSAEVSSKTISVTTFSTLKSGERVNLERALTISSRLGGHMVTGHIDGKAKIIKIEKKSNFYNLKLEIEKEFIKYIAKKGSVTINGISLTIAESISNTFEIAIIPHTFENTNLSVLKEGAFVNIEFDVLAKYVEKILLTDNNKSNINENFLKENGFL